MIKNNRITLKNLVARVEMDKVLLEKHKNDEADRASLERKIARDEAEILKCVMENHDNPYLDYISAR